MSSRPSRGAARLAAILDALPDALLLVNCNGTVVNANHIALETFEVPGTGLVGRGLLSLLPDFDSRRIPGSMRLPDSDDGRTKPTRMIARRTDGSQFPVEVTSANLEDGRTPYADHSSYTGDELLMLVVRDLTGTLDTEAELARQQRQTEMILRAAAEGVVGVDTAGKVVLVNPSAAQILGYRASDLGGQELHPLIHHSRGDGTPFPYEESPIADTLRSGRKHRVRGQVLWAKDGRAVPVDLTTAPVRDGDQLVGAVMTFTDRRAHDALAARHAQLLAVLETSLRGPLEQLRGELGTLADDPAGQLWPEANQILHHLSAGYARMSTLVDNVLAYQQLDAGETKLTKEAVPLDEVVAAGVEGAIELIGPGRAQFAVHAPAIEAEVDAERFAQALAHLIADVAGVDATGNTSAPAAASGSGDSTIVVAAAQRGEVVRIEVRGPYAGGDPVHGPIVRGIVRGHGGVLQTHDMPGAGGSAYVLEVPVSAEAGPVTASPERWAAMDTMNATTVMPVPAQRARGTAASEPPSGANAEAEGAGEQPEPQPTGRRRARPRADEEQAATAEGRHGRNGTPGQGTEGAGLVPPPGTPAPTGRRARREQRPAEPEAPRTAFALPPAEADRTPDPTAPAPTGRRARRGVTEAPERPIPGQATAEPDLPRTAFALPPAPATPPTPQAPPTSPAPSAEEKGSPADTADQRQDVAAPPAPELGRTAAFVSGSGDTAPPAPQTPPAPAPKAAPTAPPGAPHQGGTAAFLAGGSDTASSPDAARPEHPSAPGAIAMPAAPVQPGGGAPGGPAPYAPEGGTAAFLADPVQGPAPFAVAGGPNTTDAPHPVRPEAGPAHQGQPGGHPAPGGTTTAAAPQQDQPRTNPAPVDAATPAVPGRPGAHPAPGNASAPVEGAPGHAGAHPTAPHQDRTETRTAPTGPAPYAAPGGTGQPPAPAPAASAPVDPAAAAVSRVQQQARPVVAASEPDGAATAMDDTPHQGLPKVTGGAPYGSAHPQDTDAPGGEVRPGGAAHPDPHADAAAPTGRRRARRALAEEPGAAAPQGEAARPISVRMLGQGPGAGETPPGGTPVGSGRRRKLGNPSEEERQTPTPSAATARPQSPGAPQGRAFAIGAPDEGSEGPEPLDGPNGAVKVVNTPRPPMDDELPPEPLDNPRRLLVWPAPDASTQTALTERGYRPVIVHSREEVDAQIAAYPAALFVDPLTGPITRTALQSLREAAGAAEVPVLVTAGLGQAAKEAAYGADPAVLLKALAPRDSEMHPSRVLLIEEQQEIADALAATLERRGMQVAHAATDAEAATLAAELRPNLVVMDLMQVRRRRAGIIDWLRAGGLLSRTPLVVYTSAGMDPTQLAMLAAGETVLFLAERSTSAEVQGRIVDLLSKLG
ncbi:PAS domain-containing protein [Streptomyces olivoreticuli]|uniref:response regulator n=1 Tax=Streptomyces olivoreticuli TaxID=68246 RepID=UPI002658A6BF|nr:PAS domain-containing protein [Streptomyces olivoreticuli]WKK27141.1 PAS domain-containing protein [Streptomyces olivoreticuli]